MDVKNAVDNENVELPSGSIEGNTISLSIRTLGLMHTAKEFNDLIIKEDNNNIVRFSDIGRAEVAPEDLRSLLKKNGEPMVMTVITPNREPTISRSPTKPTSVSSNYKKTCRKMSRSR